MKQNLRQKSAVAARARNALQERAGEAVDLLYELCDILITGITGRAVTADRRMESDELVDDDMLDGTSPIVISDLHDYYYFTGLSLIS